MSSPHISVLKQEILDFFKDLTLETFVDCTLGAGGHSAALLDHHPEIEKLIGIDQDPHARNLAEERLLVWKQKISIKAGNFQQLDFFLREENLTGVDGILLDLGVSSMQLDMAEKGFSFNRSGPLDMRMDPSQELTAAEIVNTWPENKLAALFKAGEEKQWRLAARLIIEKRPFETTDQLCEALYFILKRKAKPGIHPLTLIFQAIRIEVNDELHVIKKVLPQALKYLKKGGRLAVITFHSGEDRIVKHFFQYEASDKVNTSGLAGVFLDKMPTVKILTRKPVIPSAEEQAQNPRSRSAKLRVIEKL